MRLKGTGSEMDAVERYSDNPDQFKIMVIIAMAYDTCTKESIAKKPNS